MIEGDCCLSNFRSLNWGAFESFVGWKYFIIQQVPKKVENSVGNWEVIIIRREWLDL